MERWAPNRCGVGRHDGILTLGIAGYLMVPVAPVNCASNDNCVMEPALILASESPRRRELLATLAVPFEVCPCPWREPPEKPRGANPRAWAMALAYFKARAVAEQNAGRWVLGADTVVACDDELLGKPRDRADAERMLRLQAGRESEVITGVALVEVGDGAERMLAASATRVWMRADDVEIAAYLRSGDWVGKAGAYGIQNIGERLIERIDGSFSNVVGLPLETVARLLERVAAPVTLPRSG